jgi:hypothetical protein
MVPTSLTHASRAKARMFPLVLVCHADCRLGQTERITLAKGRAAFLRSAHRSEKSGQELSIAKTGRNRKRADGVLVRSDVASDRLREAIDFPRSGQLREECTDCWVIQQSTRHSQVFEESNAHTLDQGRAADRQADVREGILPACRRLKGGWLILEAPFAASGCDSARRPECHQSADRLSTMSARWNDLRTLSPANQTWNPSIPDRRR